MQIWLKLVWFPTGALPLEGVMFLGLGEGQEGQIRLFLPHTEVRLPEEEAMLLVQVQEGKGGPEKESPPQRQI